MDSKRSREITVAMCATMSIISLSGFLEHRMANTTNTLLLEDGVAKVREKHFRSTLVNEVKLQIQMHLNSVKF